MIDAIQRIVRSTRTTRGGYSLLEVLIALAILATALTALMGAQAVSNQQAIFSNELSTASILARGKMVDVEYEVIKEGFSELDQTLSGTFREEGYPHMTWRATIEPVEIPDEAREELMAKVNSQLFGGGDTEGALQGNAAFSSMLPTLIGQLPELINRVGQKVRRVELVVNFPYGGRDHSLSVVQYIVDRQTAEFELFEAKDAP